MTEIGAGLQIGANASRVLARLGLGEQLDRLGVAIQALDMRDLRTDRPIDSMPADRSLASAQVLLCRVRAGSSRPPRVIPADIVASLRDYRSALV